MNEYQNEALKTARDKRSRDEIFHLLLGLAGETGEIMEKAKKVVRDKGSDFGSDEFKESIKKELGDVLWYIAVLAHYLDLDLEDVAQTNLEKLQSRQARGVLGGSGDDR